MANNSVGFRLKSSNNEYIIKIKLLNDEKPPKLQISLKHKLKGKDINFLLQKSKEELIKENSYLSQFNSLKEIFDYFIKIIKSQNIQISKPNTDTIFFYYINFLDQKKQLNIQILIPKLDPLIEILKEDKKRLEKENEGLISEIKRISDLSTLNEHYKGTDNIIHRSGLFDSENNLNSTNLLSEEKNILKENNNNILFENDPIDFRNGRIISDVKDECENFTAFTNINDDSLIVWTIKREGIIKIYDFKKNITTGQKAHNNNINSVQYFHDHNESSDYIISLSKLDDNIIKIWKIDYENKNNLILIKSFAKQFLKRDIEIFCMFNYKEYDTENSYIFIYETPLLMEELLGHHINEYKNKEIICYKLNTELDNIIWGKDEDNNVINYKSINNFYKINYLDTYYDIDEKQLYLINCNENNTEIIFNLFDYYIAYAFKYKDWNDYYSAFIKEINHVLKLFQLSANGIAIWDIKMNNEEPSAHIHFDDVCLFDFIFWNNGNLITLSDKKIITLDISGENIEVKDEKDKEKGFSKIRKIISPENSQIIVAIDDNKVKCWSF